MNAITLPAQLAALASTGHVRLVRLPGPVALTCDSCGAVPGEIAGPCSEEHAPGLIGSRVAIWADMTESEVGSTIGPWKILRGRVVANSRIEGENRLPLHPGHIVGSARITDVLPVVAPDALHHGGPHIDALTLIDHDGVHALFRWFVDHDGEVCCDQWLSDQLPFLPGLKPGDHVAVLADAKPTSERCPTCNGTRGLWNPLHRISRPCSTCGGRGSCDPIPHPGPTCRSCEGRGWHASTHPLIDEPVACEDCGGDGSAAGGDGVDLWDWQP